MAIDFAGQTTYHKEQVKELKGLFLELVLTTLALDRVQKGGTQLARRFFSVMLLVIRITTILTLPCGVGLPWHFNYSHDRRIPRRRRCKDGRGRKERVERRVLCAEGNPVSTTRVVLGILVYQKPHNGLKGDLARNRKQQVSKGRKQEQWVHISQRAP